MFVSRSVRWLCITAIGCLLGCNPHARAVAVRPQQTKAAPTMMDKAPKNHAWDLGIGTVTLPSYLTETTWYEYTKAGHALATISISVSKMPPNLLSGWVQNRRARSESIQLFELGEVEKFANPHFAIEGFWSRGKGAPEPAETTYLLVLASKQDLLMLWIQTQPAGASAVQDFAMRIVPDDGNVPPPSPEWVWRRAFDVRVPIPRGATEPKQFSFDGDQVTVLVTPGGPGQALSLIPSEAGAKLTTPVEHVAKSVQGLPVHILTSSGSDADGESLALAAATVEMGQRSLLLQVRAFGERSKAVLSAWNDIAISATFREE